MNYQLRQKNRSLWRFENRTNAVGAYKLAVFCVRLKRQLLGFKQMHHFFTPISHTEYIRVYVRYIFSY